MTSQSKSDIVRGVFAAYQSRDRAVVERLLTDDFTFTSPYDDAIDRTTYFERCWPNSEPIRTFDVERIFEQGNAAFVTYKIVNNDGKEFRNTEFHGFDGGKIRSVEVYFGACYQNGVFVKQQNPAV
jgi:ketosteroid isomerase-like protein